MRVGVHIGVLAYCFWMIVFGIVFWYLLVLGIVVALVVLIVRAVAFFWMNRHVS